MKRLLKIKDVLERIPVSRAHIYNLIRDGASERSVILERLKPASAEQVAKAFSDAISNKPGKR